MLRGQANDREREAGFKNAPSGAFFFARRFTMPGWRETFRGAAGRLSRLPQRKVVAGTQQDGALR